MNGQEYEVVVEKNGGDYREPIGDHGFKCRVKDEEVLVKDGDTVTAAWNVETVYAELGGSVEPPVGWEKEWV